MKAYIVGGAVRDALLGLPVSDRDWVVVGATPEQMLAAGFRPVGKDFPVFLHPKTHEEYALARTERKTAPGYRGFTVHAAPDVTLEEDLRRRDLTINAIAQDEAGQLVDPWGGQRDLAQHCLRHVSPAFAEDPVRILRVARFAARFTDFSLAPETLALMRTMVDAGEVDHLVPERVWQEVSRGLSATQPSRMLAALDQCGALARLMPELFKQNLALCGARLDTAALLQVPLPIRYALMLAQLDTAAAQSLSARLRAPTDCKELATMLAREQTLVIRARDAGTLLAFFNRCDAWRRPERFANLLDALQIVNPGLPVSTFARTLAHARAIDTGEIARGCPDKSAIPRAIHAARLAAIAGGL
ncbi:MAG: multifunctional CCA tRNA nucleotidyl transferase/2'3'-cyclic phosphodiesterase/2'nucleotidase/phosphatase [Betaproteobacteria bacterium]|nr:multifunctional CCA tRNA nucleotidyl transferase/2'3'-cyclic phosphodiesterase/2'nucleotidase/phosphatase [Betaproteobacteria bacterium]